MDAIDKLGALSDLIKGEARGGKYFRRVATGNPKKPWKYYYTKEQYQREHKDNAHLHGSDSAAVVNKQYGGDEKGGLTIQQRRMKRIAQKEQRNRLRGSDAKERPYKSYSEHALNLQHAKHGLSTDIRTNFDTSKSNAEHKKHLDAAKEAADYYLDQSTRKHEMGDDEWAKIHHDKHQELTALHAEHSAWRKKNKLDTKETKKAIANTKFTQTPLVSEGHHVFVDSSVQAEAEAEKNAAVQHMGMLAKSDDHMMLVDDYEDPRFALMKAQDSRQLQLDQLLKSNDHVDTHNPECLFHGRDQFVLTQQNGLTDESCICDK